MYGGAKENAMIKALKAKWRGDKELITEKYVPVKRSRKNRG